jgi:FkbM family methyltransferase
MSLASFIAERRTRIRGVIHVGAHFGQEYPIYRGIASILLFEPVPQTFETLKTNVGPEVRLVNKAVGDYVGRVPMFVESRNLGQSCSVLRPTGHLSVYPQITFDTTIEVEQVTLDGFLEESGQQTLYNLLVIDTQGSELAVLRGAARSLAESIECVVTEVYRDELYEGCGLLEEVEAFMVARGFHRDAIEWDGTGTWGDAFYRRA